MESGSSQHSNEADTIGTTAPLSGERADLSSAWYAVFVLMLCYTLSFIDRQIIGFLVAPIKRDLEITDTQVGLLGGLAFALFYTLMGLPIGWLADRANRRNVIAVGVIFWSVMTAACAGASSFWSLFAARLGVGVGEATLAPSAMSLLADAFPRSKLPAALGVYAMGIMVGSGLASIVGGLVVQAVMTRPPVMLPGVGEMSAWRLAFVIVALPGFLAAWLLATVREPPRRDSLRASDGALLAPTISEILRLVHERWSPVLFVSLGLGCNALIGYAVAFWGPPLFARVHGWSPADTGLALGLVTISFGCLGLWTGGWLCERAQSGGRPDAPLLVGAAGVALGSVSVTAAALAPTGLATVALLAPGMFFSGLPVGGAYASLQFIFPNQLRGVVSALHIFLVNAVGLTLGPLMPGLLNDRLFADGTMVGASIALTVVSAGLVGTLAFVTCRASYRHHYAKSQFGAFRHVSRV